MQVCGACLACAGCHVYAGVCDACLVCVAALCMQVCVDALCMQVCVVPV